MAHLSGIFFVAESPWADDHRKQPDQTLALTCYRRNLFQVTGTVLVPRSAKHVEISGEGTKRIVGFEALLAATESLEGKPVKLISVPLKSPAKGSGIGISVGNGDQEQPQLKLDLRNHFDRHSDPCPFTISWKRLQFRVATAKNNRRMANQQYFNLTISVIAVCEDGSKEIICKSSSVPLIVRGRSPKSFHTKKETPLARSSPSSSRNATESRPMSEHDKAPKNKADGSPTNELMFNADSWNWPDLPSVSTSTTLGPQFIPRTSTGAGKPSSGRITHSTQSSVCQLSMPKSIPVPFVSADVPTKQTTSLASSSTFMKRQCLPLSLEGPVELDIAPRSERSGSSPTEERELLYEYFPLSLNDWSEPVDAIYVSICWVHTIGCS
jgi:hypothetical protein